ncbi:hypothetical protein [Leifsonia sp. TF02-11]|uniref:hypothetical protein n=1 Tax=Leifsonia sp. TF02-11 TaxID=2815212 RepID=UPI001AA1A22A|nr:hypothetical protein [Leifsonia sp. TF02-11]MBO1739801.1 hypothetical protein [Leifsonia sp. TF02-11]
MTIYGDPAPYTEEDTYVQASETEDPDVLDELAKVPNFKTRKAVALNGFTERHTLKKLASENANPIRYYALQNIARRFYPGYDVEQVEVFEGI